MSGAPRVQTVSMNIQAAENNTALSAIFGAAITPGNYMLCVFSTRDSNPGNYTVTDDKGNTWIVLPSFYEGGGGRGVGGAYCLANAAAQAGAPTVSIGKGGTGGAAGGTIIEFNCPSGAFLDVTPIATGGTGTTASVTLAANPYDHDAIIGVLCTGPSSFVTATPLSGYTSINTISDSSTAFQHSVVVKDSTTSAAQTPGWSLSQSVAWEVLGFALRGTTTAPTITSTDTASPLDGGSLTIFGVNFGTTQGASTALIEGVAQTVTSWSDTAITVTAAIGANKCGVPLNVSISVSGVGVSNSFALTSMLPQAGWAYVDIATPDATVSQRISATPDIASGDQVAYDTVGGLLTIFSDGDFSAGGSVTSSTYKVWSTGSGWGSPATLTLAGNFSATLASVSAITAAAGIKLPVAAALVAHSTITAAARRPLTAALVATSSVSATARARLVAHLTNSPNIVSRLTSRLAAQLASAASLTAATDLRWRAQLTGGAAAMSGTASILTGGGPISVSASLAAAPSMTVAATARLVASLAVNPAIGGSPSMQTSIAAMLATSNVVSGSFVTGRAGRASLAAAAALVGAPTVRRSLTASLQASTQVAAAGRVRPRAALVVAPSIAADMTVMSQSTSGIVCNSTFVGSLTVIKNGSMLGASAGYVLAEPQIYILPEAALQQSARLTAAASARLGAHLVAHASLAGAGGVRVRLSAALAAHPSASGGVLRAQFRAAAAIHGGSSSMAALLTARVAGAASLGTSTGLQARARVRSAAALTAGAALAARMLVTRKAGALVCNSSLAGTLSVRKTVHAALGAGASLVAMAHPSVRASVAGHAAMSGRLSTGVALAAGLHAGSAAAGTMTRRIALSAGLVVRSSAGAGALRSDIKMASALVARSTMTADGLASAAVEPLAESTLGRRIDLVAAPRSWNVTAASVVAAGRGDRRAG